MRFRDKLRQDLTRVARRVAARLNRARQDHDWRKMQPRIEDRYTAERADYENKRFIAGGDTGIYGRYAPASTTGSTRRAN